MTFAGGGLEVRPSGGRLVPGRGLRGWCVRAGSKRTCVAQHNDADPAPDRRSGLLRAHTFHGPSIFSCAIANQMPINKSNVPVPSQTIPGRSIDHTNHVCRI